MATRELELELEGDDSGVRVGNVVRAVQAALTQGDLDLAARMYEDSGQHVAEQLFTTVLQLPVATRHNAARMFALARDFARAARLYEQLKAWPDAAHIYEEAGDFTEEVRIRLPPELVALAQDAGEHPVKGRGQPVHVFTMRPE